MNINSESIETLLAGGVAFATPEINANKGSQVTKQGDLFYLAPEADEKWQAWQPKIKLSK